MRADVEQAVAGIRQHRSLVSEMKAQLIAGSAGFRKHNSDKIIPLACELGTFDRLVLEEFDRDLAESYLLEVQVM